MTYSNNRIPQSQLIRQIRDFRSGDVGYVSREAIYVLTNGTVYLNRDATASPVKSDDAPLSVHLDHGFWSVYVGQAIFRTQDVSPKGSKFVEVFHVHV